MKPLVMKFGGTSVGSPEAIQRSARLAASQVGSHAGLVVVVSALIGVTNLLLEGAQQAARGTAGQREEGVREFYERHLRLLRHLWLDTSEKADLLAMLEQKTGELRTIYKSISQAGQADPSLLDAAASLGERTCAPIFAALLRQMGIPACAVDASRLILTDTGFTRASVLYGPTRQRIRAGILPLLNQGVIPVMTGFIGAAPDGRVTTLGRGASDYTSTLVGAALGAVEIWNWTDVTGVLTADPRLVPHARVISALSYEEMSLLSACGAKVLHPDTVKPVASLGIPIRVRSSFHPEEPGTRVQLDPPDRRDGQPLAVLSQAEPLEKAQGTGTFVGFLAPAHAATITVVGGKISSADLSAMLEQQQVPVLSRPAGDAHCCPSAVIPSEHAPRAVRLLHDYLFLKGPELSHQPILLNILTPEITSHHSPSVTGVLYRLHPL